MIKTLRNLSKQDKEKFVLVVEGYNPPEITEEITMEAALEQVKKLIENGSKPSDACKEAAKLTGYKKSELYSALVNDNCD